MKIESMQGKSIFPFSEDRRSFVRCGFYCSVILFSTLLLFAVNSQAQYGDSWGIPWNNPISATLSTSVWNNWTVYQLQQRKAKEQAGSSAAAAPAESAASAGSSVVGSPLSFRPSGTRLTTNKLADMIGHTPEEKAQVANLLTIIFSEFDKQAIRYERPNDLALAISFFLGQNAAIFQGKPDPRDEQFVELSDTVNSAFGNNAGLRNLRDQQKQELYEMLVGFTGLTYAAYQDALKRGDQENLRETRRLAGINLKSITHIAPERIDFTAQGLAIKPE